MSALKKGCGTRKYLYRQLSALLREKIRRGEWKPGEMLPSMDDLAGEHGINKATVIQAIADLAAQGLVYSVPARGSFVADPEAGRNGRAADALSIGWISTVTDHGNTGRYHTEMMDAVRAEVQAIGGNLLVFKSEGIPPKVFCTMIGKARLDGAIIIGPAEGEPIRLALGGKLPAVLIDDTVRGQRIDAILIDNEGGGFQAVEHLIRLGHRQLAFVTGPLAWKVSRDRLAGAQAALDAAGLPALAGAVVQSDFSPGGGHEAMLRILKMKPRPTGVFFFNDEMASGAIQALHEIGGLRVPEDFSCVGFDDTSWASLMCPPLTTIRVEKDLMGREAVRRLKKRIEDPNPIPTITTVPTRLMIRKSAIKI